MSGTVNCPQCGHVLFAIDLPIASAVPARTVSQPDAPLLLRLWRRRNCRTCRVARCTAGGDSAVWIGLRRVWGVNCC